MFLNNSVKTVDRNMSFLYEFELAAGTHYRNDIFVLNYLKLAYSSKVG